MATATIQRNVMQNYATHENGGILQTNPYEAVKSIDQINDLIFLMLEENPDPESRIQQAVKLLASLNEDLFRVTQRVRQREFEESQAYRQLSCLEEIEKDFRRAWTNRGDELASLKRDLDKLNFSNNAYKDSPIKSEDKINNYNLHFRMHHGTNNMRNEKKLLKEINASCQKKKDYSTLSVDEISIRIRNLQWDFYYYPINMVSEKQVVEEIHELKLARDKAIANAPIMEKDSRDEDR
ncbi:hypothetical protein COLO4_05441 [Corchorus olitorius]|uniref:Uncharacterized protein n=1 Tax=Corchorus olitorius TaxID=93759 RepID=A0A1R3KQW5_9ROSI|nr:hypothetical protein COLO4_05441 [Corchorus olitorius]